MHDRVLNFGVLGETEKWKVEIDREMPRTEKSVTKERKSEIRHKRAFSFVHQSSDCFCIAPTGNRTLKLVLFIRISTNSQQVLARIAPRREKEVLNQRFELSDLFINNLIIFQT